MKKVLFSATVDSHILQFHLPYLQWFKEQGYEVHVATNGNEEIPYCDVKYVVSFERSPLKINNLKAIKQMKKIIEKEKFDIIHCHTPMGSVVTRIAAMKARKKYGTRVIYTAHGFHFFKGAPIINWMMFYPVEKWLSKYTDTLITINKEDYELAKKKFKKCKDVEFVHGVGVDENKFNFEMTDEEKHETRNSLGLKDDDFVIIYVAELSKRKNQGMLIKAVKELIDDGKTNIKVLLPGKDSMNGYYQKMAKDLNIVDNIKFLGYRKDIPKLLKISNLYVSTAKQEGLPVNIMEAMLCGLPIIATDCRGNRDLVDGCIESTNKKLFLERIKEFYYSKNEQIIYVKKIEYCMKKNILNEMIKIYEKPKKILHVLASNIFSGAENVACTIIENLGDKYDMAYCSCKGPIEEVLKEKNIKYYGLDKLNIKNLKKVIKDFKPDIIHAHDYKASIAVAIVKKNTRVISHLHNNCPFAKTWNLKTIIYSLFIKKFKMIIVVSNKIYEEAVFKNKMKDNYITIYNYVDEINIIKKANMYNHTGIYDTCFIGRLTEQKNPLEFIEIIEKLKKTNKNISAVMIGDGYLKPKCLEYIQKNNLQNNITMLGFVKNPFPIIKNCKINIMPSKWEGFGLTAIESLILDVPVLNTGIGGLNEIFKENDFYICNNICEFVQKTQILLQYSKEKNNYYKKYTDRTEFINNWNRIYG